MKVQKSTGKLEKFNKSKYERSLRAAGLSKKEAENVARNVMRNMQDKETTDRIAEKTYKEVAKKDVIAAARYNLPRGMAMLGPAGFVFERYIQAVLEAQGYETIRNVMMEGKCVSHEIDLVAEKNNEHFLVEVKYHNKHHIKTPVDVAMYADARLQDIIPIRKEQEHRSFGHNMWLVTNTKFTNNAIKYGKCRGLRLLGWKYPKDESLEKLITENQLYPVSVLPSVSQEILKIFVDKNVVLVKDLVKYDPKKLHKKFSIPLRTSQKIISEASECYQK